MTESTSNEEVNLEKTSGDELVSPASKQDVDAAEDQIVAEGDTDSVDSNGPGEGNGDEQDQEIVSGAEENSEIWSPSLDIAMDKTAANASVVQFLALYIIILAFFIWLVSLAQFEGAKTLEVIKGLKATFQAKEKKEEVIDFSTLLAGKIRSSKQFQDNIRGLFSTLLGVEKVDAPTPGRTMRVIMNANTLFENEKTTIKEFNYAFMDRVIASLSERPPGYHFDMEFIIGSNADASGYGTLPVNQTLEMARAGVFIRTLLARGAPPDTVSVGIRKGNPGSVAMWFYIRSPLEAEQYYEKLKNPVPTALDSET